MVHQVKPLTEEEKKQKLTDLREKMAVKRAAKAKEEAKEAYQRCLDTPRYAYKPWSKLLDMYAEEGDIQRSLQTAVRVAAYQWGEYAEMTVSLPPNFGTLRRV